MKIVLFKGGLGNQLFQYVFYNYLIKNNFKKIYGFYDKKSMIHNGFELDYCFSNISLPKNSFISDFIVYIYKAKNKLIGLNKIDKKDNYNKEKIIFDGYWQSLSFFSPDIINNLSFNSNLTQENFGVLTILKSRNSISVHIRRGDYLNFQSVYGNICTKEYYSKAMELMKQKVPDSLFVFFSDDMYWVKQNFNKDDAIYVDWNTGRDSYVDMYLMSNCKHNIIANSTFSWWGAYLNRSDKKIVISPAKWFNTEINDIDIIPDNWIKI